MDRYPPDAVDDLSFQAFIAIAVLAALGLWKFGEIIYWWWKWLIG